MSSASKTLTFYTSVSDATKRLRAPIQIVLTLSPAEDTKRTTQSPNKTTLVEHQSPIAWQVLKFDSTSASQRIAINYSEDVGVTEVKSKEYGVYKPGVSSTMVEAGQVAKLNDELWSIGSMRNIGTRHHHFTIQNNSAEPKQLALCSYSPIDQDKHQPFIPVALLGSLDSGDQFQCTAPVLLQAYATVDYRRGQHLDPRIVKDNFLFKDIEGNDTPLRMTDIRKAATFQVYSRQNGGIEIEMTSNRD